MTGLPAGSYCNVVDGMSVAGVCTGAAYVENFLPIQRKKRLTTSPVFFWCSFTISNDSSLAVTVGTRQAIAVHTGALGNGTSTPKTAQQVPVLFHENATTTYGEVGNLWFRRSGVAGTHAYRYLFFSPTERFCRWRCVAAGKLGFV